MYPPALLTSPASNGNDANQYSYVVSKLFTLIINSIWFLLLTVLFALSLIVWLWVASFRAGWRFGEWAQCQGNEKVPIGLAYGVAVLAIAPLLLFLDWSQNQFGKFWPQWAQFPDKSYVRQLFQTHLGIELGEELPFLRGKEPVGGEAGTKNPPKKTLPAAEK